jgi:hypothetical protein
MTIYKQFISPGINIIEKCARILSVGEQRGKMCVWYAHLPTAKEKKINVLMTGEELHINTSTRIIQNRPCGFIGTVLLTDGDFVLHAFDMHE